MNSRAPPTHGNEDLAWVSLKWLETWDRIKTWLDWKPALTDLTWRSLELQTWDLAWQIRDLTWTWHKTLKTCCDLRDEKWPGLVFIDSDRFDLVKCLQTLGMDLTSVTRVLTWNLLWHKWGLIWTWKARHEIWPGLVLTWKLTWTPMDCTTGLADGAIVVIVFSVLQINLVSVLEEEAEGEHE